MCTVKILLVEAWAFIRSITFHGDGGGHLLERGYNEVQKSLKHPVAAISQKKWPF